MKRICIIILISLFICGCQTGINIIGAWKANCTDQLNGDKYELIYIFKEKYNGKLIRMYNGKETEFKYTVALFENCDDEGAIFIDEIGTVSRHFIVFKYEGNIIKTYDQQPNLKRLVNFKDP